MNSKLDSMWITIEKVKPYFIRIKPKNNPIINCGNTSINAKMSLLPEKCKMAKIQANP